HVAPRDYTAERRPARDSEGWPAGHLMGNAAQHAGIDCGANAGSELSRRRLRHRTAAGTFSKRQLRRGRYERLGASGKLETTLGCGLPLAAGPRRWMASSPRAGEQRDRRAITGGYRDLSGRSRWAFLQYAAGNAGTESLAPLLLSEIRTPAADLRIHQVR